MIRSLGNGALALAAAALSACAPAPPKPADVTPLRAWARATAPGQESGGIFLTLRNRGGAADRLIGGSSPAAGAVEIHSMTMDGDVMRMRRQPDVEIAPGQSVTLEPGGTHLMLMGVKAPLAAGAAFPLTLQFAQSGQKQIEVKVLPIGSSGPKGHGDE